MMPSEAIPPFYNDLAATLAEAWAMLARGATDRRTAFHTPAVATIGRGGEPEVRTVVLRAVDVARRELRFHTDVRSRKVAELRHDPRISLLFYDADAKVQLRVGGVAEVHTAGSRTAEHAWHQSQAMSRLCYGQRVSPGVAVEDPAASLAGSEDAERGQPNFCAVEVRVERLEWLYLAVRGHRRALFVLEGATERGTWLAP